MRRVLPLLFAVVFLSALWHPPARAWTPYFSDIQARWKWDSLHQACGADALPPANDPGDPGWRGFQVSLTFLGGITGMGWQGGAETAAQDWSATDSAYGNHLVMAYDVNTPDRVTQVTMDASDLGPPGADGKQALGTTGVGASSVNGENPWHLDSANIVINTDRTIICCLPGDPGCPQPTQMKLELVMDHELGHGLGLGHPVTGPGMSNISVVECLITAGENGSVTSDDNQGIMFLYAGHPNDLSGPSGQANCTGAS